MGAKTRSQVSSERQKWDKIFEGLVNLLKTQQQQLETLAKERKILGDRIKMQYERWVSDVRFYEDYISQMRSDLETKEMARVLEAAKADMMVGLMNREAYLYKLKLKEAEDELTDFRLWFDLLSKNSQDICRRDPEEIKKGVSHKDSGSKSVTLRTLEYDAKRLQLEYENLASEKSSHVAALMAENKFAGNQFNILESQCTDKLNSEHSELEKANGKIGALISKMEELRASNAEKDEIIERLKSKVSQKEPDARRFPEDVSKMSRDVELLRKSRSSPCTPIIKRCASGGRTSVLGGKSGGRGGCNVIMKKESSAPNVPDILKDNGKGSRSSKRKRDDEIPISETAELFTSTFKVPRLKAFSLKTRLPI